MKRTNLIAEAGKQELFITHTFDAPRDLVFKMMLDPNLLPQWWGPKGLTTTVDKMDVKPGGVWRFVQREPSGEEYAFHGVYHSIEPGQKVIQTFEFEGMPDHVILETMTFAEHNGQTTLTEQSVYQSVDDRDGMINSGMEQGSAESMERFADLLAAVRKE